MNGPLDPLSPGSTVAVAVGGACYAVSTSIACQDARDAWWEHELQTAEGLWLAVEHSLNGKMASLWRRQNVAGALPDVDRLQLGAAVLLRVDAGSGRYRAMGGTGALGIAASGDVAYVEYRGDGQHVAYEQFGRDGPVMQGSKVKQLTPATSGSTTGADIDKRDGQRDPTAARRPR